MGYISKYDTTFINFVNKKYKKCFRYWDDYVLWLYWKKLQCNREMYYITIEKDLWEYSDWQTALPGPPPPLSGWSPGPSAAPWSHHLCQVES